MPKGEFENLLRFEASRRKERGDVINKNDIGWNEWLKMFNLRKRKWKAPLIVPWKPLGVYSHSRRRTYHVCLQNIRRTPSQKKLKNTTLHALNYELLQCSRHLHWREDVQTLKTNYADVERGAKGDIE